MYENLHRIEAGSALMHVQRKIFIQCLYLSCISLVSLLYLSCISLKFSVLNTSPVSLFSVLSAQIFVLNNVFQILSFTEY